MVVKYEKYEDVIKLQLQYVKTRIDSVLITSPHSKTKKDYVERAIASLEALKSMLKSL